jgi:hypothetical protein
LETNKTVAEVDVPIDWLNLTEGSVRRYRTKIVYTGSDGKSIIKEFATEDDVHKRWVEITEELKLGAVWQRWHGPTNRLSS